MLTILFLIYSWQNKARRHPVHSLFNHYLCFNILASLDSCLDAFISLGMISPLTDEVCNFDIFVSKFVVLSQSFQLFLVGLILLAERSVLTQSKSTFNLFKFLFEDPDLSYLNDSTCRTLRSCLVKNGRNFTLVIFYMSAFGLSALFSPSRAISHVCESTIDSKPFQTQLAYILVFSFSVFFFYYVPMVYYFVSAATCFHRCREVMESRMQVDDIQRIRLAKKVTVLNCLLGLVLAVIALANKWFLIIPRKWFSLTGLLIDVWGIFATIVLFLLHEGVFLKARDLMYRTTHSQRF